MYVPVPSAGTYILRKVMRKIIYVIFFACVLQNGIGYCQDSIDYKVLIKNVVVPQEQITLDSMLNGNYFFSGIAKFDIESSLDSVNIHVYLEDVPFKRYRIMKAMPLGMGEDTFTGNSRFIKIDSICTGDVGRIKSKKNCTVYWHYATKNRKNHCRIKIGTGNFYYANTKTETTSITRGILTSKEEFWYNNLGLLSKREEHSINYGSPLVITKVPKYTIDGQVLVDDTTDPFVTNAYDNQGRAIFRQEANANGLQINFVFGYVYDSLSRAVQRQHLPIRAKPFQTFQDSSSTEYISYDSHDRIAMHQSTSTYEKFTCLNPYPSITVKQIVKMNYGSTTSRLVDSVVRDFLDINRNFRLVSRIINKFYYRQDGLFNESVSISKGYDDPGSCWGTQFYEERKSVFQYDAFMRQYRYDSWGRNSVDSSLKSLPEFCASYRREYDAQGNTIKQFDFCDQNETLRWTAQYNQFNFIIQQTGYGISDTSVATYQWELLDLDKQQEILHE